MQVTESKTSAQNTQYNIHNLRWKVTRNGDLSTNLC